MIAALACAAQTFGLSPLLKALARFAKDCNNDIDVFIFDSGVKVGNNGTFTATQAEEVFNTKYNITQHATETFYKSNRILKTDAQNLADKQAYDTAQAALQNG